MRCQFRKLERPSTERGAAIRRNPSNVKFRKNIKNIRERMFTFNQHNGITRRRNTGSRQIARVRPFHAKHIHRGKDTFDEVQHMGSAAGHAIMENGIRTNLEMPAPPFSIMRPGCKKTRIGVASVPVHQRLKHQALDSQDRCVIRHPRGW